MSPADFDQFIQQAWQDHADDAPGVAQRLRQSLEHVDRAERVAPYARLVSHVFGEHLGDWSAGVEVMDALRARPGADDAAAALPLARYDAGLRVARGDAGALDTLPVDERIAVQGIVSSAFSNLGRFDQAVAAYDDALALAAPGLPDGSPALRALAVGGNNLAASLEELPARSAALDAAMLRAAEGGLVYWRRAGTWLEEERAEHRFATCLLAAGQADAAAAHASACLGICERHAAPPFERFFGWVVLARAQQASGDADAAAASAAQARAAYAQVAQDERQWCEAELAQLDALG